MASKVQNPRGAEIVGEVIQKKKNAVEGRKILGDIGNVVPVRGNDLKPQPPVTRRITRGLCAQLVANGQAEDKVHLLRSTDLELDTVIAVDVDGNAPLNKKTKPVKSGVESKPIEVIEISPDTREKEQEKALLKNKRGKERASGKKKVSYSSILTARSKAVCRLDNLKSKEKTFDIDGGDVDFEPSLEYMEDMYKFYKAVEKENSPLEYIQMQTQITEKMRAILVNWLVDVHNKFDLTLETLYLTINVIDRFLAADLVPRRELQLVGISALLIASKYEEIWPPTVDDLVEVAAEAYSGEQILRMEKSILGKLEWYLTVPTHYVFLVRFIKASIPDKQIENMVHYIAELGMMNYGTLSFCPSLVAASAVYVARCAMNQSPAWTDTLEHHTSYSETELRDCAKLLAKLQSQAKGNDLKAVYKKYATEEKSGVALMIPAKLGGEL